MPFADNRALLAHSEDKIKSIVGAFATASSKFGQKINITKTEVMIFQPNSNDHGGAHYCRQKI